MILPELTTTTANVHIRNDQEFTAKVPATIKIGSNGEILHASTSFLKFMSMDESMIVGNNLMGITQFESDEVESLLFRVKNGSVVASEIVFKSIALRKYVSGIFSPGTLNENDDVVELQVNLQ